MRWSSVVNRIGLAAALAAALVVSPGSDPVPVAAALAPQPSEATAGGLRHRCAIVADATVECWGANDQGQLGDGTTNDSLDPVTVQGLSDVVAIDGGTDFSCALTASGTVGCWGRNTSGSLGDPGAGGFESTPTFGNGLTDVAEISVGETHACARLASGAVRCWGDNDDEQLGDGTSTDATSPVAVVGLVDAVQISAGFGTTCAVRAGGGLTCWGYNGNGLWGNGTTTGSATPVDVPEAGVVRKVDVGTTTLCVIDGDGFAHCAGNQPLGDGSTSSSSTLVAVDFPPVLDISVGGEICVIAPDASVWCWGTSFRGVNAGQAVGFFPGSDEPELVPGLADVTAIDAALAHTCAGTIDGALFCWGVNAGGELQIPGQIITEPGAKVPGVSAASMAMSSQTCAVTPGAEVWCWGADLASANVSFDDPELAIAAPSIVDGVGAATRVAAGPLHTCAARTNGEVVCWGFNAAGEFGVPPAFTFGDDDPQVEPPTVVPGVSQADNVALGFALTCSTTIGVPNPGGGAFCWGAGSSGQIGNGTTDDINPTPSPVTTSNNTIDVDLLVAGHNHVCGRFDVDPIAVVAFCWGDNRDGQVGDGTTDDRSTPMGTGIISPKALAAGDSHTCAIDGLDALYCWGLNDEGQVGTGTTSMAEPTPVLVAGLPASPVDVAAGSGHTCAVLNDGTAACWGLNNYRQTGQTLSGNVMTPMVVPGVTGATSIAAGGDATCAVLADQSVTCWGSNLFGGTGLNPYVVQPRDMGITDLTQPTTLATEPIFHPVVPARLLETRPGLATVDGAANGDGIVRGGTQIEIPVAGRAGIPDDAAFAIVNVTAVQPVSGGYFTVHGCLSPRPDVAGLNYSNQPGDGPINLGNESIVQLSPNGSICLFTSSTTHATIDVTAYGTVQGGYEPTTPERILETRADKTTGDGEFELAGPLAAGTEVELQVGGRAGIDGDADAAVLYIAAVTPSGVGFVTAHPCLSERPLASSLNYSSPPGGPGTNRGNEIIAPLSDDGTVCIYVSTTTHLTVDVMGSVGAPTTYETVAPARILETRVGETTVDGQGELGGALAAGQQIELQVGGRAGVAPDASFAVVNLTSVQPAAIGFVTGHPCEPTLPLASSLNFAAPPASGPVNGGNEVLLPLSSTGTVCLYVSQPTHLTLDVVGYA